ncbi:DNA processing protein [Thioclava sp. ES.031]|uniref:DNA-processing protein DprA n=1 Tax=Thioclava sp. ES.031 TaxID=1798203 RepID=UPI000BF2CB56|nr:DNA-processing protein DprA [Thioclava sp. ES.031]PFG61952.1 DNA processing protein [Thioclava sp. ES.031]
METDLFSYPTPFTPPTTEEDELPVLRLIRSRRVGPTTFHRLIGEHGSAAAALAALPEVARAAGVTDYAPCPEKQARAEIKAGKAAGARLLIHGGPGYPAALAEIDDAPPVLWALGQLELLTRPMVALVGARNASSLGLRMAKRLSESLGEAGICVVSGLARGIDAAAHEAALPTGTIAVQAGGIDVIYPQENTALARQMAETGLRLTEAPPGTQPQARHFPARNRIISGLSAGVVVVEAALKSGSLITARDALDQGREVMAVPGHPMDGRAAPPDPRPAPNPPPARRAVTSGDLGAKILERLGPSPTAEDQVIRDLDVPAAVFSQALTALEIEGKIERHRGGLISRPL